MGRRPPGPPVQRTEIHPHRSLARGVRTSQRLARGGALPRRWLVGELSRAGLLDRTEDESDRRRTLGRLNERYSADAGAWLRERLDPFGRTLERLSPAARANFLDGWRILEEETARTTPEAGADCGD
jgi:hypothetical protein